MKFGIALIMFGLLIVGGALSYALYAEMHTEPTMTACTLEAKLCADGTVVGREGPHCEFAACPTSETSSHSWIFEPVTHADDPDMPEQTAVKLAYGDQEYHFGTYDGSCALLADTQWEPVAGEKDGAVCWFAGVGVEIGLFEEGGHLRVKRGLIEEGTAETEGFRGDFVAIYTLP